MKCTKQRGRKIVFKKSNSLLIYRNAQVKNKKNIYTHTYTYICTYISLKAGIALLLSDFRKRNITLD